jgi:hypothetical protein
MTTGLVRGRVRWLSVLACAAWLGCAPAGGEDPNKPNDMASWQRGVDGLAKEIMRSRTDMEAELKKF